MSDNSQNKEDKGLGDVQVAIQVEQEYDEDGKDEGTSITEASDQDRDSLSIWDAKKYGRRGSMDSDTNSICSSQAEALFVQKELTHDKDLSCCNTCRFFSRHSWKDIKRRKCNFCLAFCSVFVVVLSTILIKTVVGMGPIIFLKMGEDTVGQYDAVLHPAGEDLFVNYT